MIYESHVTIDNISRREFLDICNQTKVKPVIIEDDSASSLPVQMMTSKFHKADKSQAMEEMFEISNCFPYVVRRKLERILPFGRTKSEDCLYEEYHSKFLVESESKFIVAVYELDGVVSKNIMHPGYMFVTSRDLKSHQDIIGQLRKLYKYVGTINEHVVFDDNPNVDNHACFECPLKVYDVLEM